MGRDVITTVILIAGGFVNSVRGQANVTTLVVELENVVEYQVDTSDLSKWGTNPNITPGSIAQGRGVGCAGVSIIGYGDIVAVNGQPARGTYANRGTSICTSPSPGPGGFSISDTTWNSRRDETFEILQGDGITPVGTIMTIGLNTGSPTPPGPAAGPQNYAIVGGTGAFLGARGQKGNGNRYITAASPERTASITEDPAMRRRNGGGRLGSVLYVIPMSRPAILATPGGPAVTHCKDFTVVNASQPAMAGEALCLFATGLGPTRSTLDPAQPFPSSPLAVVNSPVDILINGKPAEVLAAVGFPGTVDRYQVNFRLPAGLSPGTATIRISVAWITGTPVSIAVR